MNANNLTFNLQELPHGWKWFLLLGIMNLIFGIFGVAFASLVTITTTILFGILMFLSGVIQMYHWFKAKETDWHGRIPHILFALFYIIGGIVIFLDPVTGASALTITLAVIFILIGSMRLGLSILLAIHHWRWLQHAIGGVLALILGIYILIQWPLSSLWVIGLFISIEMILNGWQMIFISFKAKKLQSNA